MLHQVVLKREIFEILCAYLPQYFPFFFVFHLQTVALNLCFFVIVRSCSKNNLGMSRISRINGARYRNQYEYELKHSSRYVCRECSLAFLILPQSISPLPESASDISKVLVFGCRLLSCWRSENPSSSEAVKARVPHAASDERGPSSIWCGKVE